MQNESEAVFAPRVHSRLSGTVSFRCCNEVHVHIPEQVQLKHLGVFNLSRGALQWGIIAVGSTHKRIRTVRTD